MEVSELRKQLTMSYNASTSASMERCFSYYIIELDDMMLAIYGKMWDAEQEEYT